MRKFQAVACEVLLSSVAISTGAGVLIPNAGIQYRLLQATGFRVYFGIGLLLAGVIMLIAVCSKSKRFRKFAASVMCAGWFALGMTFIDAKAWVPILYTYAIYFLFCALISYKSDWE